MVTLAGQWQFVSRFVLRGAGLPATWQTELRAAALQERVDEILRLEQLRATERGPLLGRIGAQRRAAAGPEDVKGLRRAEHFIRRGVAVPAAVLDPSLLPGLSDWNVLCGRLNTVRAQTMIAWCDEDDRIGAVVQRRAADPAFQEAVFLNSPDALGAVRKVAAGSRAGYDRRLVVKYAQRFGAKTETASFFGPTNYGTFDPELRDPVRWQAKGNGLAAERHGTISYWICQEIADVYARSVPVEQRRAYRSAVAEPLAGTDELIARCDGGQPIGELSAALSLDPARVRATVARWERDGLVRTGLRVPATVADPLAALRSLLPTQLADADDVLRVIAALESFCERFERSDLPVREQILAEAEAAASALVGHPVRRGGGTFYADRFLYSEEAAGNIDEMVIGAPIIDRMREDLSVMLDVLASEAVAIREAQKGHVRALLGGSGRLPATRLVDLASVDVPGTTAWQRLLSGDARTVRLTRDQLVAAGLIRDDLDQWPLFCAPDIMLVPGCVDGGYAFLLAEAHYILPPTQLPLRRFDPLGEYAIADLRELLRRALHGRTGLIQGVRRLNKALNYTPVDQCILWLDWQATEPGAGSVRLADLEVVERAGRLSLRHRDTGERFELFPEYEQTSPDAGMLRAVALPGIDKRPISIGRHTPRILIGEGIYQRERWDLHGDDLPTTRAGPASFDAYLDVWRWKERWGLPHQVFVRLPGEEKPFIVDLTSPPSVDLFLRASAGADRLGIEEMLPAPEQLWLAIDGEPYCSELRLTAVRRRAPRTRLGAG